MPRNIEKDAEQEKLRRERLIDVGFKLFSEYDIENVSLQNIADEAEVGIATLYNYYGNKVNLVVAISASIWNKVWKKNFSSLKPEDFKKNTAYDNIAIYCDNIIEIYKTRPDILRFSADYKTFIRREQVSNDRLKEHLDVLRPVADWFHESYLRAKKDHSIRLDISEKDIFSTVAFTMLGMAERYAQGIVWDESDENDKIQKLLYLKEMLLDWCVKGK